MELWTKFKNGICKVACNKYQRINGECKNKEKSYEGKVEKCGGTYMRHSHGNESMQETNLMIEPLHGGAFWTRIDYTILDCVTIYKTLQHAMHSGQEQNTQYCIG